MKKRKRIERNHDSNLFQLLMFRFFPYWPLFLGLTTFMLASAWIYLQIATPVYKINATLLIKDEKKGVENSRIMESLDILTSKKIVENEIEVIRSRTVMGETVELLQLCSPVFEEGLFSPYSAYTTSPVTVEVKDLDQLTEVGRVDFTYHEDDSLVDFDGEMHRLGVWFRSQYGEIRFVKNIHLKEPGIGPFYVAFLDRRKVIAGLLGNLSVQPSNKLTTVINLSIHDAVPVRGENILNTLMESYTKAAIRDKNSVALNTLQFVEERIRKVEHDLDSLEQSIQQYKSTRGIVDLSEQGKVFLKNVGDNDQKLSALDMQMAVLNRIENYVVQRGSSSKFVPSTLGIGDERLSVLIQKLYESELEYERLKKTTAENNPVLLSLQNEIENLRPGVLENIRNQKASLVALRSNLSYTNSKYASVLTTIPQQERELLEANRQQVIKNDVYTFLLQKREEATQSSASTASDSRLVDKAESSLSPVAPKRLFIYGGAIALACFIAIAWVAKKEHLSNKVLFRSEIQNATKIPIVAEISDSQADDYIVIDNLKKPFLTDQFIQLRTSLGIYGNSSKKVLMVTSSIGGEGKSFVSANFAISQAGSNKKVLILDLDFRNPRLSHLFNATDISGVSEFLEGTAPIENSIRRTFIHNLFIMSVGAKRTKATELLLEGNVALLFARLRESFDLIIVDTPPVTPVLDAFIISQYCDATLFVVRHGKTPKITLRELDSIKVKVANNMSIVFNGVKPRGLVKTPYGYGFGSSYEYEYVYSERPHLIKKLFAYLK